MRKILTVVVALALFAITFGTGVSNQVLAKDVAVKTKPGCPAAAVDAAKNLKLIAPIPAPIAARKGGPKGGGRDKILTNRIGKPSVVNDDCN